MPEPEKKSSGLWLLLLAVPMLGCCGLPLLVVAGAAILGTVSSPPFIAGAVALASVAVGYLVLRRARRGRAGACCLPSDVSAPPSEAVGTFSANGSGNGSTARRGEATRVRG